MRNGALYTKKRGEKMGGDQGGICVLADACQQLRDAVVPIPRRPSFPFVLFWQGAPFRRERSERAESPTLCHPFSYSCIIFTAN